MKICFRAKLIMPLVLKKSRKIPGVVLSLLPALLMITWLLRDAVILKFMIPLPMSAILAPGTWWYAHGWNPGVLSTVIWKVSRYAAELLLNCQV